MKKLISFALAFMLIFACVSCTTKKPDSGNTPTTRPQGNKIVIYCGGSAEYSVIKGSEEDKVIDAIEQAFYDDTNISLDFDVAYLGANMQSKLSTSVAGRDQVDIAISHTRYGSGIDDYAISQDIYYDLSDLIDIHGSNISEKSDLNLMTTFSEEIIGIPSQSNPYKFGILVRKDYMNEVGYTDDPAQAEAENLTLLKTIEQFEDMCVKMKAKEVTGLTSDSQYSISGTIWDIEKVFTGAFSDAGYFSYQEVKNEKGEITSVVPGFATEDYAGLLQMEYDWVSKFNILSANANTTSLEASEGEFISGKTGVFLTDPSVSHLIRVARKTKQVNKDAEFTVIGPLSCEATPDKAGFIRQTAGYKAAVVMKKSKRAEDIIKFVNWMYADVKNYNLCAYGIEGTHWIDNGDGTYSYPEGKEEYLTKAPYSGIISLVENQNMSNLIYNEYTEEEKAWLQVAGNKNNYVDNNVIDYILPRNAGVSQIHSVSLNNYYNLLAVPAWYGNTNPSSLIEGIPYTEYFTEIYLEEDAEYIDFITQNYKLMKASREI